MGRTLALVYGLVSYLIFFVTFLYAIGFVGNLFVPKSIDTGGGGSFAESLIINVVLLSVFALQHSAMARPAFKRWWTKFVPKPVERSTYVLFSSLALILLFWLWQPMTGVVWSVENTYGRDLLWFLFFMGWGTVLLGTYLINHFDLFGLRQVYLFRKGEEYKHLTFVEPFLYKVVRHPIMLGFIVAFWATPLMTVGHLLFAVMTTAYILVAVQLEEHDMLTFHGEAYEDYQKRVPMIVPIPKRHHPPHKAVRHP